MEFFLIFFVTGEKDLEMAAKVDANGGGGKGGVSTVSAKVPAVAHPLAEKPDEVASNISYHAQFSPHFSPFKFELEQAYYATAESVRDRLIRVRGCTSWIGIWMLSIIIIICESKVFCL